MKLKMSLLTLILLSLGLLTPLLAETPGESPLDVNFDGLTSTHSVTIASDIVRTPSTLDIDRLEEKFTEADEEIDELLKQFRIVLNESETDEWNRFRTWEETRYSKMKLAGATIERGIKNLAEKIDSIIGIFRIAEKETLPQDVHISLMEKYGHMIRLVTYHNVFQEWGLSRKLRFETAQPFNEKWCHILKEGDKIDFPDVSIPSFKRTESAHFMSETQDSRENALVREQNTLSHSTTIVSLPLSSRVLDNLIREATDLIESCQKSREQLQGNSIEESYNNVGTTDYKSLEYRGTIEVFEKDIKPICADFILNMITLKAFRNEILARISVSKNFVTNMNTRSEWKVTEKNFNELCEWGKKWLACFDRWNKLERKYRLLPFKNFQKLYSFKEKEVVREPIKLEKSLEEVMAQFRTGVTTHDVAKMLTLLRTSDRYSSLKNFVPSIQDLTMSNAIKLSTYLHQSQRASFMKYARDYIK